MQILTNNITFYGNNVKKLNTIKNINKTDFANQVLLKNYNVKDTVSLQKDNIKNIEKKNLILDMSQIKVFEEKIIEYPMLMDRMGYRIKNYLQGDVSLKQFAKNHLDDTAKLIERIQFGVNGEKYAQNYQPEIEMIKNISKNCNLYNQNKIKQDELDDIIIQEFKKYINTNFERETLFYK